MKSIDVKSLLIGFLLCTTYFLSVGAKPVSDDEYNPIVAREEFDALQDAIEATEVNPVGTYQMAVIGHTRYLLDTRTGVTYDSDRGSDWRLYIDGFESK